MEACWTGTVDATPRDLSCQRLVSGGQPIADGTLLVLENPAGATVECVQGWIWVTQENDARDIVLGPGQTFRFDRAGKAIVQGLQRARVIVA